MQQMNQTIQKSKTTYRETSTWLSIVTITLAFGYYFGSVVTSSVTYDTALTLKLIAVMFVFVLVQATGHRILATVFVKEALGKPTEHERRAELVAYKVAYYVLVFGVFAALALMLGGFAAPVGSFRLFNTVLFFFVLAELTKYAAQLVWYRRPHVSPDPR